MIDSLLSSTTKLLFSKDVLFCVTDYQLIKTGKECDSSDTFLVLDINKNVHRKEESRIGSFEYLLLHTSYSNELVGLDVISVNNCVGCGMFCKIQHFLDVVLFFVIF